MTSNLRPDQTAAPSPDETEPMAGGRAPDRVAVMRQADSKLQQAEMKL